MFQVPSVPFLSYFIQIRIYDSSSYAFPHSDIHGSMLIYSSPWLFAVSRVLLRLLMPRHSPYALFRLNFVLESQIVKVCFFAFTTFSWQNCSNLPFFVFRKNLQFFLVRFSSLLSARFLILSLYSVFNDHLPSPCESSDSGGPEWSRTTDLAIISRVL